MRFLCLSNGHGEDAIALRILRALQQQDHPPEIAALPLVGEGQVYDRADIPVIGPVKAMPSGGFVYMDGKQLARDVRGGLVALTRDQIKAIRVWCHGENGGGNSCILAVGDIVPLLFAWLSGVSYAFVGTAKSEYYLRNEEGPVSRLSWFDHFERWSGSVYVPWERWLMSRPNCKAVIPRDSLTTHTLKQWSIPAYDLGNPMMDSLDPTGKLDLPEAIAPSDSPPLTILLLPGSRAPEAHRNWQLILTAIASVQEKLGDRSLLFVAAIAPSLDLTPFIDLLPASQWRPIDGLETASGYCRWRGYANVASQSNPVSDVAPATLILSQTAFNDGLHQADVAIALAGTATEQFVGLGKPAITIPGTGPQFTPAFAEAQTRLLGPSIIPVQSPQEVGGAIASLLNNPEQQERIRQNGQHRMGQPGASERIAACLINQFG